MRQVRNLVSLLLAAVSLAGCTYDRGEGPPGVHFAEFRVAPPDKNSVEVCHAYTCQMKTDFYFRSKDIQDIAEVMRKTKKGDNPYNNFLSMYFVIQEPERDLLIKIPGKIDLDPVTGQIKVTFDDLPQFPLSDMQLTFKGGVRSALANPRTCGTKVISADFYSWADPNTPHRVTSSYDVVKKPDGSPCCPHFFGLQWLRAIRA